MDKIEQVKQEIEDLLIEKIKGHVKHGDTHMACQLFESIKELRDMYECMKGKQKVFDMFSAIPEEEKI